MAQRKKRQVKQRSRYHSTLTNARRKKRVRSRRKVGNGARRRRAKKS